ncbi:hypothetical protein VP01_749g2 [Puccinia sorghi]|uniref:Uncharacterized protein n=1 Tax=Puccinia sorghi TaxID=27349 RepID=A0A0L6UC91_9BASI|nr:hypothetical protein VP01_749g2 [Puccinia sorghi]
MRLNIRGFDSKMMRDYCWLRLKAQAGRVIATLVEKGRIYQADAKKHEAFDSTNVKLSLVECLASKWISRFLLICKALLNLEQGGKSHNIHGFFLLIQSGDIGKNVSGLQFHLKACGSHYRTARILSKAEMCCFWTIKGSVDNNNPTGEKILKIKGHIFNGRITHGILFDVNGMLWDSQSTSIDNFLVHCKVSLNIPKDKSSVMTGSCSSALLYVLPGSMITFRFFQIINYIFWTNISGFKRMTLLNIKAWEIKINVLPRVELCIPTTQNSIHLKLNIKINQNKNETVYFLLINRLSLPSLHQAFSMSLAFLGCWSEVHCKSGGTQDEVGCNFLRSSFHLLKKSHISFAHTIFLEIIFEFKETLKDHEENEVINSQGLIFCLEMMITHISYGHHFMNLVFFFGGWVCNPHRLDQRPISRTQSDRPGDGLLPQFQPKLKINNFGGCQPKKTGCHPIQKLKNKKIQMRMPKFDNFWFFSLCLMFVIFTNFHLPLFLLRISKSLDCCVGCVFIDFEQQALPYISKKESMKLRKENHTSHI